MFKCALFFPLVPGVIVAGGSIVCGKASVYLRFIGDGVFPLGIGSFKRHFGSPCGASVSVK